MNAPTRSLPQRPAVYHARVGDTVRPRWPNPYAPTDAPTPQGTVTRIERDAYGHVTYVAVDWPGQSLHYHYESELALVRRSSHDMKDFNHVVVCESCQQAWFELGDESDGLRDARQPL